MTEYNELRDGQEFYAIGYKKGYEDAKKEFARPQGEWGWSGSNGNGRNYYNCSVCGRLIEAKRNELINFPYCHCGAQMEKQEKLAYEK